MASFNARVRISSIVVIILISVSSNQGIWRKYEVCIVPSNNSFQVWLQYSKITLKKSEWCGTHLYHRRGFLSLTNHLLDFRDAFNV